MNKRLGIKVNLSIAFHLETDGQTERTNQNVKQNIRTYVNYMQDNWPKWLLMIEFADNNNSSVSSSFTPFFLNKGFYLRISFSPDYTSYKTTKQRLDAAKAEDIAMQIKGLLAYAKIRLLVSQAAIKGQTDRKKKDITYSISDWVWLNGRNIKITRLYKSLEHKHLGFYQIIAIYGRSYELRLLIIMRIYPVFSLKLLCLCADDLFPEQKLFL